MRSKQAKQRTIQTDPIYKSKVVTRMINNLMLHGKKSIAEHIVYSAIESLHKDPKEAVKLFEDAVKVIMPKQEVRSRRVGGATYQIPYPVKHGRSEALSIRWIIDSSRKRREKSMELRLAAELKDILQGIGNSVKKRDDIHKMADSNKAFSHFRI
jgi:small subunit ribosomal protein S7